MAESERLARDEAVDQTAVRLPDESVTSPAGSALQSDLQSSIRRAATARLATSHEAEVTSRVQRSARTTLTVGPADDPHEREADAVADTVVRRLRQPDGSTGDEQMARSTGPRVQRAAAVVGAAGGDLDDATSTKIERARSGGKPLDAPTRSSMEGAFGADFSAVRIHDDHQASELSTSIQASAFTIGSDIFFNGGSPDTDNAAGQHLLAHELAHTIQQSPASAARRTVRRRYLDNEKNWVDDTEYKGTFGFGTAGRSKPLVEIDKAVEAWNQAYTLGNTGYLELAAQAILDKITAWETKKGKSTDESMRADDFRVLRDEATHWLGELRAWKGQHAAVAQRHATHRQLLQQWVDEGRAQTADQRLRNACEWVATGKTRLFVVSEAPGPRERGAVLKNRTLPSMPAATRAYFPNPLAGAAGSLALPVELYETSNIRSKRNLLIDEEGAGTKGWNKANHHIAITEEGIGDGRNAAWGTLKHEVQHDADKHQEPELAAGVVAAEGRKTGAEAQEQTLMQNWQQAYQAVEANDNALTRGANDNAKLAYETFTTGAEYVDRDARVASEQALQGYKTEYRAHFYEGRAKFENEPHNPARRINRLGMRWTRRQWAVFTNIFDNYPYVKAAWGDHTDAVAPTTVQTAFRIAVNAYWNPDTEGFNKYDSPRVDDLYRALDAVAPATTDAADAQVVQLLAVAKKLDESDLRYLADRAQSVMFSAKIDRHLDGAARAALRDFFTEEVADYDTGLSIAGLFS
jgi:hypothetical protein